MAQKISTLLFDDLELRKKNKEVPADETIEFSLDGRRYQIDLTSDNATKFRTRFTPYTDVATRLPVNGAKPSRTVAKRQESADIRRWAKDMGIPVSERGRIPGEIVTQYEQNH
jgi:hypothetical protein